MIALMNETVIPEDLPHHHHSNIGNYPNTSVQTVKEDIRSRYELALERNIEGDKTIKEIGTITNLIGSSDFEDIVSYYIGELIQENFSYMYKQASKEDVFSEGGELRASSLLRQAKNISEANEYLDRLIGITRTIIKNRLGVNISYTDPVLFFYKLAEIFKNSNDESLKQLESYCIKLADDLPEITNGGKKDLSKVLEKINGSWIKIFCEGLWEKINADAHKMALEKLLKEGKTAMNGLDPKVWTVKVTSIEQTGWKKNDKNNQQIKADSFMTVELVNEEKEVKVLIKIADSTKFSTSKGTLSGKSPYRSSNTFSFNQLFSIEKLNKIWNYWNQRWGAFVESQPDVTSEWENTINIMNLYAAYAALVEGTFDQPIIPNTLTFNDKVYQMSSLITIGGSSTLRNNGYKAKTSVNGYRPRYTVYYKHQNEADNHAEHKTFYNDYMGEILRTKLKITVSSFNSVASQEE